MCRSFVLAAACAVAIASAHCGNPGGGGGSGSPTVDAGSGGGSGGGSGPDAGAGSEGGGSSTDGGSGGGTDGGSGGGGSGGGTDGGTATNECDGLMPDPGAKSISITTPSNACGSLALSDQAGNLAFAADLSSYQSGSWATYDSNGDRLGAFGAFGGALPRESGWFAINTWTGAGAPMDQWHLWTRAPDGTETSNTSVGNDACGSSLAHTSAGGVLVLSTCGNGRAGFTNVMAFDDSGKRRFATAVDAYPAMAAGDANGNLLVAAMGDAVKGFASSDLVGRWIGPDGAMLGGWFVITTSAGPHPQVQLRSRIGGGIAVMQEQVWRAVLPSGGAPQPPPAWLADRTGDLHIVRGRKAHAFTSNTGGSEVEIVAPSGSSCGKFDAQGSWVRIGTDGSVMASSGSGSCNRIVWPGLLRAR